MELRERDAVGMEAALGLGVESEWTSVVDGIIGGRAGVGADTGRLAEEWWASLEDLAPWTFSRSAFFFFGLGTAEVRVSIARFLGFGGADSTDLPEGVDEAAAADFEVTGASAAIKVPLHR